MPAVIAENDVSIWDDETGAVYHYPRRYSAILKPGVQVVYYKGKLTDKSLLISASVLSRITLVLRVSARFTLTLKARKVISSR